ncbi:DUF2290 domain-containing protein [Demequina sp. NBRC 110052]|uniref:DUF2290 domain-containing protein n=1 Tax=Demequina sp. NBRC 110052 TaxID=1570341 RepID=UPI00135631AB|nr:DUF2290 domain-containing protein [Demequina sp. NBRC 110052]
MGSTQAKATLKAITAITTQLVRSGIVDDQEWPKLSSVGSVERVDVPKPVNAEVLKSVSYEDLYQSILDRRSFNFVMLDRALVQMSYEYEGSALVRHRLAFLPSPNLDRFQDEPDLYFAEVPWVEVVGSQSTAVPLRFDFDARPDVPDGPDHPPAHFTIGQYRHCRVPVSGPLTPDVFVDFVIRHFYRAPGVVPAVVEVDLDRVFDPTEPQIGLDVLHIRAPRRV